MKNFKLLIFGLLFFAASSVKAQVTSVDYQMKYDTTTCLYDCYLIVNSGSAISQDERIQFNAQYSIIVPTGTGISIAANHNPLEDNTNGTSTTPMTWNLNAPLVSPAAQPESDFHSITPTLTPTSRYNTLMSGDTVKLFSLQIDTTFNCAEGIRIFDNGVDPGSDAPGMEGTDYSNGFTIGSTAQVYNSNSEQVYPPKPVILDAVVACSDGIEIDITASTSLCQGPLEYSWTGPAGYSSTTEDVFLATTTDANNGDYTVVVTDAFGCSETLTITATSKPETPEDFTTCAGTCDTIVGTPSTGTWSANINNPFGATLQPNAAGSAIVCFSDFSSGDFEFIYSIPGCSDTMTITVDPQPLATIVGEDELCIGETSFAFPNAGGVWTSEFDTVATITSPGGIIQAVGPGVTYFTFTDDNGCPRTVGPLTVNPPPTTVNTGSDTICVDDETILNPTIGGDWVSTDTDVFTITDEGVVTGIAAGTAAALFTSDATGCVSDSLFVTVEDKPVAILNGPDSICVNGTTNFLPSVGGTWTSSNTIVADIDNNGQVTGKDVGFAVFQFTSTASGCVSELSDTVWVTPAPTVAITGDDVLCIGETSTLSPTSGGVWVSNNPGIASVDPVTGVVTAEMQGSATFTFTDDATGCFSTTETLIVDPNPTVSSSRDTVCITGTAELSAPGTGTWQAVNPAIASLSGTTVTGVAEGTAAFLFTSNASGCTSDTLFVEVQPRPTVEEDDNLICVGQTAQLTPNTGGTWMSSNDNIATVDNTGEVVGVGPGAATFTFTSTATGCESEPSDPIFVIAAPVVDITGPEQLCIGFTSTLSPVGGGTWASTNTDVATVDPNTGVVTAVAPGNATFIFTALGTGCPSAPTDPIIVNEVPEVQFDGPNTICITEQTSVSGTGPGTWESLDTDVATIDFAGVITGVSAGEAELVFTLTSTGCTSDTLTVTVTESPTVDITGASILCIGATTTLSPTSGGVWSSNNTAVAEVDPLTGVVTAIAQGQATFTFISDAGCGSGDTDPVIVNGGPTTTLDETELCIGENAQATPDTLGTWVSNNPGIASIDDTGLITALAAGEATFTYTDTVTGCVSDFTEILTVNGPTETTLSGPDSLCIGTNTQFFPSVDGTWESSNEDIATINNSGTVTAVSVGRVVFYFTDAITGCISPATDSITVTPGPTVTLAGPSEICIGDTTYYAPATGGTWVSNNPTVASIDDNGLIIGIAAGQATFTFTSSATGCSSEETEPIIVHGPPTVYIDGTDVICIGGTTQLFPASGGTWVSLNPAVATVDPNTGEVTGQSTGTATFEYTSNTTGCTSNETLPVTVSDSPDAEIVGPDFICIGAETQLSPGAGGTWTSSNPLIATVTNTGVVTGIAPGQVTFTFNETASGCSSQTSTDPVTITNCVDPDFNATYVDVPVNGDVSTNDEVPNGTTYGTSPLSTGSPSGSVFTLTMGNDGMYTFVADVIGVYTFEVPVCIPPKVAGCPTTTLTITVIDFADPENAPIANVDIASTFVDTPVELITLENDHCVITNGCTLDPATVLVTTNPVHGMVTVDPVTGNTTYTPGAGFVGTDTLTYQVCVTGEPGNCASANQVIVIADPTAPNTTVAADDFNTTAEETPVSGDVSINDNDPEGDNQTVTGYSVSVAAGDLVLNNDGTYTFTPNPGFYGPVDFPYTTCDDNVNVACADATLHILVVRDLTIKIRVYLEGALHANGNEIGTTHTRPLMRDNLRKSGFTSLRYIPDVDPYTYEQGKHDITNKYDHQGPGAQTDFTTLPDPNTIFADKALAEDDVVDWVFVELRSKSDSTLILATRSGLVQRDGDVQDTDGDVGLRFPGIDVDDYYVVVRHRNHLGAMTAAAKTPAQLFDLIDFTVVETGIYDFGTNKNAYDYTGLAQNDFIKPGYLALWGGDFDGNKKIKADNPFDDLNFLFSDVFGYSSDPNDPNAPVNFFSNFDFAYGYAPGDFDLNSKSKFDNPNDDKNMLYGQLLFYPLNATFLSNFDFFLQQIPE